MYNGLVSNNTCSNADSKGANVYTSGVYQDEYTYTPCGEFHMFGGTISGDGETKQSFTGGAITNTGLFEMTGGVITGCVAGIGGAVLNIGTATITGGTITGNLATDTVSMSITENETQYSVKNGNAIVNYGVLNLGAVNLVNNLAYGNWQDVSMACLVKGETTTYGTLNIVENISVPVTITFMQIESNVASEGTKVGEYFTTEGNAFANYISLEEGGSAPIADATDFVSVGYTFTKESDTVVKLSVAG